MFFFGKLLFKLSSSPGLKEAASVLSLRGRLGSSVHFSNHFNKYINYVNYHSLKIINQMLVSFVKKIKCNKIT